jgi:hypothetical protein
LTYLEVLKLGQCPTEVSKCRKLSIKGREMVHGEERKVRGELPREWWKPREGR